MVHQKLFENFVNTHKLQLISSGVPHHLWETLYRKVSKQIFDAGGTFCLLRIDYEDGNRGEFDAVWQLRVSNEQGIKANDSQQIYIVDHAWTFRMENAKQQLYELHSLRSRLANLLNINQDQDTENLIEEIYKVMWKYCNYYSIANAESVEEQTPIWYIMDEVGSAIGHSDDPNFRMVPFFYIPDQMTYSVVFPVKDVDFEETVTRNFVEVECTEEERAAYLLPWQYTSFLEKDHSHKKLNADYFLSGHVKERIPSMYKSQGAAFKKSSYKVYSEYNLINKYLTDPKFKIVDSENDADILWYTKHYKTFDELAETPEKFINQFPFEYVLTIKDLLCIVCRRKSDSTPDWLPVTYNLKIELVEFVSYFQKKEKAKLYNYWIIKPFNLARGLDTYITNNINCIMRLATTGPKVAQQYIENPVLFFEHSVSGKVKFDIRYVLLLVSVKPLKVYAYKNFFLRFANKPFELKNFEDYSQHFTVMNYTDKGEIKHMLCSDFKVEWEMQYADHPWVNVEKQIFKMFSEVFECAVMEEPPCGIASNPQSRALYAADVMLEWAENEIHPKLLEINWMPDCKRACEYYKDFYNDIFNLLFFDVVDDVFQEL
ncbi:tubulin--tyrosine ligase-like protein 12 [Agrilus planipennis]|uniref:Tubulin--tyrosine ligase-like protein 12 n=1 Tax=Agrilus planipennis TaxID=224129 RepID=A0A1W4XJB1_AGRPL|nr:tubulin--tyrosine ligase-like protein 12 [Agrilus planipennis]